MNFRRLLTLCALLMVPLLLVAAGRVALAQTGGLSPLAPPDIDVLPLSLSATLDPDQQETQVLDIANIGSLPLEWVIVEQGVTAGSCTPANLPWVSADPTAGTTPFNSITHVNVTFDSAGLTPGVYDGELCIESNDPDEPAVVVPLTLTVEEVVIPAEIDINPTSLASTQFPDEQVVKTLDISNLGGENLNWTVIEAPAACGSPAGIPWLAADPTAGSTPGGSTSTINVTFDSNGLTAGIYTALLCLSSNDTDEPLLAVPVQLTVVDDTVPPDMVVDPTSLASTQFPDEQVVETLDINNMGGEDLNWTVAEAPAACDSPAGVPWLSANPTAGSTPGGGSSTLDVTFDSTGMTDGVYTALLCLNSNDADEPLVEVPVELTVEALPAPPDIDVLPLSLSTTLPPDEQQTQVMDIANLGGLPLEWVIEEQGVTAGSCTPTHLPWVSAIPTAGTTPFSSSTQVDVIFDSTGLSEGVYSGELCIASNDPDEPTVLVPLTLTVDEDAPPPPPVPNISLAKTVGTDPAGCATSNNITVPVGTEVTYCYKVTNTGNLTLTTHDLADSELGNLLTGHTHELPAGASFYVTATATINEDTTNTATWTAYGGEQQASAVDSATVTVFEEEVQYLTFLPLAYNGGAAARPNNEVGEKPTGLPEGGLQTRPYNTALYSCRGRFQTCPLH